MVIALLLLAVSLVLCTQMICSTWRDIRDDDRDERSQRPYPFDQER